MHGRAVIPLLEGRIESVRDAVFAHDQARCSSQDLNKSMVWEGCWKYVYSSGFGSELYNLNKDPNERENLSGREEFSSVELSLKDRLLEWHVESSGLFYRPEDAGSWEDETCFYDESKFGKRN